MLLNPFRAVRRVRQMFAAIEAIPALQNKVDQIMVAHQKDARFVERLEGFRERGRPRTEPEHEPRTENMEA